MTREITLVLVKRNSWVSRTILHLSGMCISHQHVYLFDQYGKKHMEITIYQEEHFDRLLSFTEPIRCTLHTCALFGKNFENEFQQEYPVSHV